MDNEENNFAAGVSIVIPCYNEEKYIGALLSCLARQTLHTFEVIVVDGFSHDDTKGAFERALEENPVLQGKSRFVSSPRKGPSAQRNFGASLAHFERIVFFDADVQIKEEFLERVLESIAAQRLDLATTVFWPVSKRADDKAVYFFWNIYLLAKQFVKPNAIGFCIFTTRSAHCAIQGFDEAIVLGEDSDYVVRAHERGFAFRIVSSEALFASVRRLDKEGRLNYYGKCILAEIRTYFQDQKKISDTVEYEFGHYDK